MVSGLVLHGLVLVAEDEEVDGGVELCLLLGVLVKAGVGDIVVVASFHLVVELLQAMPVRPAQSQTDAQIGMQPAEQPLVEFAFKHTFQELVAFVARSFAVAVDEEEFLAFDGFDDGLAMQFDADFIMQIAEAPQVVVADEQVYRDARIGELGQFALHSDEASRNHGFVFKPEVEEVAHQVKLLAVGTNHVEEAQQLALTLVAVFQRGNAQMEIGDEVNGHQNLISVERRMSSVIRVISFGSTAFTALMTSSCEVTRIFSSP